MLGHYDAEYDTALRVFKGQWYGWHSVRYRNADGNLYVRYLNWNGDRWDWSYNWLDNDWNDNNPAAVSAILSFLSSFGGRVLFCELTHPATEISTDFFQLYRKRDILFIVERFCFPEHHKQYLESV